VEGKENEAVFTGKLLDKVYLPEGGVAQRVGARPTEPEAEQTRAEKMTAGARIYQNVCKACHQDEGVGLGTAFPPLAKSDYLMADEARAIRIIKNGLSGVITVNGQTFNSVMPALNLTDREVAAVATFVRNSWGNQGDETTMAEVKAALAQAP